jgi:hypothetical protein
MFMGAVLGQGLVGGSVPLFDEVILSLSLMNTVRRWGGEREKADVGWAS